MLRSVVIVTFFTSVGVLVWTMRQPPVIALWWIAIAAGGLTAAVVGSAVLDRAYYGNAMSERTRRGFEVVFRRHK